MIKHLTEEEIAMCAEALENGNYQSLPRYIREHVVQCDECAEEILTVADIVHSEQLKITPEVEKKDKIQKFIAWGASIAAAIALILLLFDLNDQATNNEGGLLTQETISNNKEASSNGTITKKDSGAKSEAETLVTKDDQSGETDDIINSEIKKKNTTPDTSGDNILIADNHQKEPENTERNQALPSSGAPASGVPPHLQEKADTIRFLAHFEPDEDLEKLVDRYKGNLRNSGEVKVVSPLTVTNSNNSITIKWENPGKKRLIIEVFNNEGSRIIETETTKNEYTLKNLDEGLYYWKLISENFELLFCGKIVIKAE
ncbi:hypothetical protein [Marinilabilia rubra]|uniref:Uncharacterized protein n=1 Tax=Marinilabilia rubra TaxID=2162893 RepID=A0A2U2B3N5_9BACT|nr:hypothetical protein [Marinilabilia rubra]PWD97647.1 hypothetical protein DDZ16_19630 [Marinilabilia rubra]